MPSKTISQARLMAMCAHSPGSADGKCPPKSVAVEFNQADKRTGILKKKQADASIADYATAAIPTMLQPGLLGTATQRGLAAFKQRKDLPPDLAKADTLLHYSPLKSLGGMLGGGLLGAVGGGLLSNVTGMGYSPGTSSNLEAGVAGGAGIGSALGLLGTNYYQNLRNMRRTPAQILDEFKWLVSQGEHMHSSREQSKIKSKAAAVNPFHNPNIPLHLKLAALGEVIQDRQKTAAIALPPPASQPAQPPAPPPSGGIGSWLPKMPEFSQENMSRWGGQLGDAAKQYAPWGLMTAGGLGLVANAFRKPEERSWWDWILPIASLLGGGGMYAMRGGQQAGPPGVPAGAGPGTQF